MIDVNTTSKHPTHFLRAVEIIKKARDEFRVPSENWPYPTLFRFGIPNDHYYAEVWGDGMDWQPSYWIIEELDIRKPQVQPLIIFNSHEERAKMASYEFDNILHAMMYYRRDFVWAEKKDRGVATDSVWPFLTLFKDELRHQKCKLYAFKHASQERVIFWLNEAFIPEEYRGRKKDWNNRDSSEEHGGGISLGVRPVS